MRFLAAFAFAMLSCCSLLVAQADTNGLQVRSDPQNLVANSLIGAWRLDAALNQRLGHKGGAERLEFRSDATVVGKVPAALAKKLSTFRIYLAGTMVMRDKEHAFLVTELAGNPTIVWFRERGGDPLGDAESWSVALVRAEAQAADVLFVGGDNDNQSHAAYARETKVVGKLEPTAALTEMIRLLQAGKAEEFVDTYVAPLDLAEMINAGRSRDKLVARFQGERVNVLIERLENAGKRPPTMNAAGDLATWPAGQRGEIRLQLIDGRWYIRN